MDVVTLALAKTEAMAYTDAVGLSGVGISYPTVNPTTRTWRFFDPVAQAYIETPHTAIGQNPTIGPNGNWHIAGVDTGVPVNVKGDPGDKGEVAQYQTIQRDDDHVIQYRYATQTPTEWTDLYTFPSVEGIGFLSNAEIQEIIDNL